MESHPRYCGSGNRSWLAFLQRFGARCDRMRERVPPHQLGPCPPDDRRLEDRLQHEAAAHEPQRAHAMGVRNRVRRGPEPERTFLLNEDKQREQVNACHAAQLFTQKKEDIPPPNNRQAFNKYTFCTAVKPENRHPRFIHRNLSFATPCKYERRIAAAILREPPAARAIVRSVKA